MVAVNDDILIKDIVEDTYQVVTVSLYRQAMDYKNVNPDISDDRIIASQIAGLSTLLLTMIIKSSKDKGLSIFEALKYVGKMLDMMKRVGREVSKNVYRQ